MQSFSKYVSEALVDLPKNTLDYKVFNFIEGENPQLNPGIKKQIMKDIFDIELIVPVKDFYIIGSILTKHYNEKTDIDVTIEIDTQDIDNVTQEKLLTMARSMNGKLAVSTQHPINYYFVSTDLFDDSNFDGIYDVKNERWLKEPKEFNFNIQKYLDKFENAVSKIDLTTAALRRDIIDYQELSKFDKSDILDIQDKMEKKLDHINNKIETLIDARKLIKQERNKVFQNPLTPEELIEYQTKNALPANIIYKMLEKYYYWNFIQELKNIIGEKDKIEHDDVPEVKQASRKLFGESLLLELRKLRVPKVDWRNAKDKKRYAKNRAFEFRGTDRETMRQVPEYRRSNDAIMSGGNLSSASKIVNVAKKAPQGVWMITNPQVGWIAQKYHHNPPNVRDPIKHLGNTGIIVWRRQDGRFFLVKKRKPKMHHPKTKY